MAAAALLELQVRADRLIRDWCGGDCGCYSEQAPRRVIVGPLTFRICECCGGRVTYDRRLLVRGANDSVSSGTPFAPALPESSGRREHKIRSLFDLP